MSELFINGIGINMAETIINGVSSSPSKYYVDFTDSDLAAGILTVSHGLNLSGPPNVVVFDNTGNEITPDEINEVNGSSCTINLASYGTITGTWSITVVG